MTLVDALAEQDRRDSPWRIVFQWRHDDLPALVKHGEDAECPNGCGSNLKLVERWNDTLRSAYYYVCVKCRTRRRNAINYRTRSKNAKRRAALMAKRTRLRKRLAALHYELEAVEAELALTKPR